LRIALAFSAPLRNLNMDERVNFDINESLKLYLSDPTTIETPEADAALVECESDRESLTNSLINSVLNPIIDSVAENPDAITRSASFDSIQFLLKYDPIPQYQAQLYCFEYT
jgi:condensin complex subunit 1